MEHSLIPYILLDAKSERENIEVPNPALGADSTRASTV